MCDFVSDSNSNKVCGFVFLGGFLYVKVVCVLEILNPYLFEFRRQPQRSPGEEDEAEEEERLVAGRSGEAGPERHE